MNCREGLVLDEAESPGGALQLVAYQENGTVWIGVKPTGSPLKQAIGLHTGSSEHYVEATASIHRTWGVAFGAVSPEIERVEVRNERGEAFEGRIVSLPASFDEEFRAAWGVATSCRQDCTLTAFDDMRRLIDGAMLRPSRRDLTAEERLELIRAQCDSSMKYHTWALKRMPSIQEQAEHVREVENSRRAVAMWLAHAEGADDAWSAVSAVDVIIQRYDAAPDWQEWEPGKLQLLRRTTSCGVVRRPDVPDVRAKLSRRPSRRGVVGVLDLPRARGDRRSRGACPAGCEAKGIDCGREGDDGRRDAERALLETPRSDVKEGHPDGTPTPRCGGRPSYPLHVGFRWEAALVDGPGTGPVRRSARHVMAYESGLQCHHER